MEMETETPEAPEIEELPDDPDTEAPEPEELPEDPEPLPEEVPGELPEQAGEAETAEVPAEPGIP
jgi:hypothetical protein